MRAAAWDWLTEPHCPAENDPALWARLLETPYDDLRLHLIDRLHRRASRPGMGPHDLAPVWCAVLLGVHRGGRQKRKAVEQIRDALLSASAPAERAESLLPILALAVRSVRGPEQRAGLSAVATIWSERPEWRARIAELLPGVGFE